jgi:RimJ/RimL family protein N-acetyltransferase
MKLAESPRFDIRYTDLTDAPYLRDWLSVPEVLKWFPMSDGKEMEDAVQCWIGFSRYQCSLTALIDGEPCAVGTLFLMPYRKVAHHCLFKLVVNPAFQRQGIGRVLLKNLEHLAKHRFRIELIHIEVFEGNPLIALLKELSFHEFGTQDRFVKDGNTYLGRHLYEKHLSS